MKSFPVPKPALDLVTDFAAHLAFLLNAGDRQTNLDLFALQTTLLQTLRRPSNRRLVGAELVGKERHPEEVAQSYFDSVLDRRLMLARANHTHKGHELYLALCRRGLEQSWTRARLERIKERTDATPAMASRDFASVAERLNEVDKSISGGNPARNTREGAGILYLVTDAGSAEVAEELSIWKGICCSPHRMHKLEQGPSFDAFCSIVIKAVEQANAPFGAIVALGLSPYDWRDLSTNTAKKLGAFLAEVKRVIGPDVPGRGDLDSWRMVWQRRTVPEFASADALWKSAIGRALRFPVLYDTISMDENGIDEARAELLRDGNMMEAASFQERIEAAHQAGILEDYDLWLYEQLFGGTSLAELEDRDETRRRLGTAGTNLAEYVEALTGRVLEWVQTHLDAISDEHPDMSASRRNNSERANG